MALNLVATQMRLLHDNVINKSSLFMSSCKHLILSGSLGFNAPQRQMSDVFP